MAMGSGYELAKAFLGEKVCQDIPEAVDELGHRLQQTIDQWHEEQRQLLWSWSDVLLEEQSK